MTPRPPLWVSENAEEAMTNAARRAHPDETGGILVGVLTAGHPWIVAAMEIDTRDRGRTHYRLPANSTRTAVLEARTRDTRLGYLGDWHSHPHDIGPSPTDLATLAGISLRHPRQPHPTLIVVRKAPVGYNLDARRIVICVPRVCRIISTGPLPQAPTNDADTTPVNDTHD